MHLHRLLHVLLLAAFFRSPASAQAGGGSGSCSVGPGFQCSEITASTGNGLDKRNWVRAVILWRYDSRVRGERRDTMATRLAAQRHREVRRAAEDSGHTALGGSVGDRWWIATYKHRPGMAPEDTLFVLGARLPIPLSDSALVVMVDGLNDDTGTSVLVGTAWMPAELEAGYWPRHWTSGDTTFMVRPRFDNNILRAALLRIPSVRSFLERRP